jgi:acetyl esterase/lipase
MDFIFDAYKDAKWLIHDTTNPPETKKVWEEIAGYRAKYPMAPGSEMVYLDDTTPEGIERKDYQAAGQNIYFYRDPKKHANEDRVIYYIHGGGFIRGNGKYCRYNAILQLQKLGLPVVASEYRTAPQAQVPCAFEDTVACYDYIVNELHVDPKKMIITGDRAGGTLGVALIHKLIDDKKPLPAACAWYSPCLDLQCSGPSHIDNIGKDYFFPKGITSFMGGYAPDMSKFHDPYVSPMWGDFHVFPPTYFVTSDTEVMCSDCLITADKLDKAGVKVSCHVFHDLWHTFEVTWPYLGIGDVVYDDIRKFANI